MFATNGRMDEGVNMFEDNGVGSEEVDEELDIDDDASYRTSSYDDDGWAEVDEDNLLRLKRNDPTLNQLEVSLGGPDWYVEWEKESRAIAENTQIKYLFVANPD